jgi:hypothetical protein
MSELRDNPVQWIIDRLHEPSSWRGMIWFATAAGLSLSPEAWDHIMIFGMATAGLLGFILRDKKEK